MKISILLMVVFTLSVSASTYAQNKKFSLKMNDASVKEVIEAVESQSDFYFFFKSEENALKRKVNVNFESSTVDQVLNELLKGTGLTYKVVDKYIAITPQNTESQENKKTIKGKVTDKSGMTLPGVSVMEEGTTNGVTTDEDGNYSINIEGTALTFSFVGMLDKTVEISGRAVVDVVMEDAMTGLDEVVVVGYGTQKKSNLTGSVASVSAAEITQRPTQSISSALSGTMSGVTVVQTSGAPGSQKGDITIRGKNSINGGSPLVIVDGVPASMDNIDMEDVENISVLKDAASAAIYGVSAANGVILITTKKGNVNQKPRVSYSNNFAWTAPTYKPEYLSSAKFAELYNEAYKNENPSSTTKPYSDEDIRKYKDGSSPFTHPNTNWFDETLEDWAYEQHHHVNIVGGTKNTSYSGSLGMLDQGGLISNIDYERYNVRTNIQSKITDRLSVGINLSGYESTRTTGWATEGSIFSWLTRTPPTVPIYNEDGTYSFSDYQNPLAHIGNDGFRKSKDRELFAIFNAEFEIIKNLKIKGVYSGRYTINHREGFKKFLTYKNSDGSLEYKSGTREMYEEYRTYNRETTQLLLNYNKKIQKHDFALLAGFEQYESEYDYTRAFRNNFASDELFELNAGDEESQKNSGTGNSYSRQSYFGRIQYNFANKYLLEGNLRYDGTSRFTSSERWGLFPAFSAAWRISEEDFIKEITWIDNLKIRGGWGSTGNSETGLYETVPTYSYNGKYILGDKLVTGVNEGRYANAALTWATVKSVEGAIEGSVYNGLLGFEYAIFKKKTTDMILKLPVPSALGMSAPNQNAGELENKGWDLSLTHKNKINDISYNVKLTLSHVKNKLTDLKGTEGANPDQGKYWRIEGESFESFYGYETEGLFKDQADIDAHATQTGSVAPGDIKYKDQLTVDTDGDGVPDKGDGVINGDDRVVIGNNFPTYTFGFHGNVSYKNFDLSLFFQGASDVDVYFENEASYAFFNGGKVLKRHEDRWTPDNKNAGYPRLTLGMQHNYKTSDYWLEDGSYVRLKNITLGYNTPKELIKKIGLQKLRVYFSGENLLTFAATEGFDPEAPSVNRGWYYGNVKKLSFGIKATF